MIPKKQNTSQNYRTSWYKRADGTVQFFDFTLCVKPNCHIDTKGVDRQRTLGVFRFVKVRPKSPVRLRSLRMTGVGCSMPDRDSGRLGHGLGRHSHCVCPIFVYGSPIEIHRSAKENQSSKKYSLWESIRIIIRFHRIHGIRICL
jgi:hypothetical protein